MPLGAFVPHYQREIPDDFPYNPYWRDVWITALSVTCRGEFNFIIASFALGAGLIDTNLYAAIVFAVLLACVIGPLLLSRVILHYNDLSKAYLTSNHPIHRIGNTCDGYRPLFLSIQARTPVHWGLQDDFKKALENAGLIIIDHRSWHTLGMNSVDITELFVQDTKVKVRIAQCFADLESGWNIEKEVTGDKVEGAESVKDSKTDGDISECSLDTNECQEIEARCNDIREVLVKVLLSDDPSTYTVKVSQWKPFSDGEKTVVVAGKGDTKSYCLLQSQHDDNDSYDFSQMADEGDSMVAKRRESWDKLAVAENPMGVPHEVSFHPRRTTEPFIDHSDLWDIDCIAQEACRLGYVMVPVSSGHYDVTGGLEDNCHGTPGHRRRASTETSHGHRRRASTSSNSFVQDIAEEAENIKERLHGYVRD